MGSVLQPAAPIAVLVERIEWHINPVNTGGLLHGLKYLPSPEWRVDGEKDLPNLCIIEFSDDESGNKAGAVSGVVTRSNTAVWPEQTITLMLSVKRKHGLYAKLPATQDRGLLDWLSYLRDALELDSAAAADTTLKGTCVMPFQTKVRDNVVRELSWSVGLEVTLYPRETVRGTRKDLMAF